MITAIVSATILMVLALVVVWLSSPAFRVWTEKPKYTLLERNELFERAAAGKLNQASGRTQPENAPDPAKLNASGHD